MWPFLRLEYLNRLRVKTVSTLRDKIFVSRQLKKTLPLETQKLVRGCANIIGLGAASFLLLPALFVAGKIKTNIPEEASFLQPYLKPILLSASGAAFVGCAITGLLARHATIGSFLSHSGIPQRAQLESRTSFSALEFSARIWCRVYIHASILTILASFMFLHVSKWKPIAKLLYSTDEPEKKRREHAELVDLAELKEKIVNLDKRLSELTELATENSLKQAAFLGTKDGSSGFKSEEDIIAYKKLLSEERVISKKKSAISNEKSELREELKLVSTVQEYSFWRHFSPAHWALYAAGGSICYIVYSVAMGPFLLAAIAYGFLPARFVVSKLIKVA